MRLIIKFNPLSDCKYDAIGKYDIQGFIYSLLKDTEFKNYHDIKGFKFFTFSNIFPVCDFKQDNLKTIIISSPSSAFIKVLYYQLSNLEIFRLNKYYMEKYKVKLIKNNKCSNSIITGTPIVLFENNYENRYYSFNQKLDFNFFFNRLKENALKKYVAYTQDEINLESDLFDSFEFNREVSMRIIMKNQTFIIIGSLWKVLEKNIAREDRKFYNFLFDCGLGEKNSLGMGFINNRR